MSVTQVELAYTVHQDANPGGETQESFGSLREAVEHLCAEHYDLRAGIEDLYCREGVLDLCPSEHSDARYDVWIAGPGGRVSLDLMLLSLSEAGSPEVSDMVPDSHLETLGEEQLAWWHHGQHAVPVAGCHLCERPPARLA